jgi:hypothetical protein
MMMVFPSLSFPHLPLLFFLSFFSLSLSFFSTIHSVVPYNPSLHHQIMASTPALTPYKAEFPQAAINGGALELS